MEMTIHCRLLSLMCRLSAISSNSTRTPLLPSELSTFAKVRHVARRMILVVDGEGAVSSVSEAAGDAAFDVLALSVDASGGEVMVVSR